jgi:spore germination cell wall hydrolase CwlJ-like protein
MSKKTREVLLRSDRVFVGALAVILSVASAALGAAAADRPGTDEVVLRSTSALEADAQPAAAPSTAAPKAATVAVAAAAVTTAAAAPAPVAATPTSTATPSAPSTPADVALAQLLAEHRCLSEVLYYEARGEGASGQMAVAEVIFHRLRHGQYGHSICAVVYEGAGTHSCQFSFACHGELAQRKSPAAWRSAEMLAARILTGETQLRDTTGDATHFHAASIQPDWAGDMVRTVQIGNHVFYKRSRSRAL